MRIGFIGQVCVHMQGIWIRCICIEKNDTQLNKDEKDKKNNTEQ